MTPPCFFLGTCLLGEPGTPPVKVDNLQTKCRTEQKGSSLASWCTWCACLGETQPTHGTSRAVMPPARGKKRAAAKALAMASFAVVGEPTAVANDFVTRLAARLANRLAQNRALEFGRGDGDRTRLRSALEAPFDAAVRQVPEGTPLRSQLDANRQHHLDALIDVVRASLSKGGGDASAAVHVEVLSPALLATALDTAAALAETQDHAALARACEFPLCDHMYPLLVVAFFGPCDTG